MLVIFFIFSLPFFAGDAFDEVLKVLWIQLEAKYYNSAGRLISDVKNWKIFLQIFHFCSYGTFMDFMESPRF